jgi:hypothetical protein
MTTNIPVGELTATVTGTGGLVTDAAIEAAGPSLRVNFATNTLTGASLQTYTVQIKHGVQVMATLTVHVSGSGWEVIDGKLVALTETPTNLIYFTENATICPTGSSQPRSPEEAMWYEDWLGYLNVHNNDKYIIDENGPYRSYYYSPEDGYTFTSAGVTWLGAPIVRTIGYRYVNGDPDFELYVVSCVFQHRILSSANTVTLQMNLYRDPTDWVTYPHGQVFYNYDLAVRFKCVVW